MLRYLEDFSAGEIYRAGGRIVDRDESLAFAAVYDPQAFHLDDAAAADTYFGRISCSGWQTCAMTMGLLIEAWGPNPASLGSPGVDQLRWVRPVYPGDTLRVEIHVTEVRPSRSRPDMGSLHADVTTFNQHDEPVLRMTSVGLYRRRP